MKEQELSYDVHPDMLTRNEYNELTPIVYQRMVLDVVERHFTFTGNDEAILLKKGVSWVMLSMTAEIKSRVFPEEYLTAKTWISEQEGYLFRREIAFYSFSRPHRQNYQPCQNHRYEYRH